MFCCTLLYVHSSFAIISMGKRELVALLCLSSWLSHDCCVALPRYATGLSAVYDCGIPDHTHYFQPKIPCWGLKLVLGWAHHGSSRDFL